MTSKRMKRVKYGIDAVRKRVATLSDVIENGEILAIDPSIISSSSVPGWAIGREGKLVDSGTIEGIDHRCTVEERLQFIGSCLRKEFDNPDLLLIEHVENHGGIKGRALTPTVRSTGTFIGSFECPVISIIPLVWIRYCPLKLEGGTPTARHKYYKQHFKSDTLDAEMILHSIYAIHEEMKNG